jgi:hypothetical protein
LFKVFKWSEGRRKKIEREKKKNIDEKQKSKQQNLL